jgi:DNA-binding NarL/FixJ family response regulator
VTRRGFLWSLAAGLLAGVLGNRSGDLKRGTRHPLNGLSPREREVLTLRARGWSKAQIRRELHVSFHTVETRVENILAKLGVHSELEAVALVFRR